MLTPTFISFMAYSHVFDITWPKHKPTNGWCNYKGSHDTIEMRAIGNEFKLTPSYLTYAMTLFVKLNSATKTFTCFLRATPKVSSASNSLIVMWQGAQLGLMKLMTKSKVP